MAISRASGSSPACRTAGATDKERSDGGAMRRGGRSARGAGRLDRLDRLPGQGGLTRSMARVDEADHRDGAAGFGGDGLASRSVCGAAHCGLQCRPIRTRRCSSSRRARPTRRGQASRRCGEPSPTTCPSAGRAERCGHRACPRSARRSGSLSRSAAGGPCSLNPAATIVIGSVHGLTVAREPPRGTAAGETGPAPPPTAPCPVRHATRRADAEAAACSRRGCPALPALRLAPALPPPRHRCRCRCRRRPYRYRCHCRPPPLPLPPLPFPAPPPLPFPACRRCRCCSPPALPLPWPAPLPGLANAAEPERCQSGGPRPSIRIATLPTGTNQRPEPEPR